MPSPKNNDTDPKRVLRASDLSVYTRCPREWFFYLQGTPSANRAQMERGEAYHEERGRRLYAGQFLLRLVTALLVMAALFLLFLLAARGHG